MNRAVAASMISSSQAFAEHVWPEIQWACGGGELTPVESVTAEGMTKTLDVLAGIDAWQVIDNRGYMRGIASRVQEIRPGEKLWNTFTVRSRRANGAATEYAKRLGAIRQSSDGALYPGLTVQAYVRDFSNGPLLSAAVVRTVDLIMWFERQLEKGPLRERRATAGARRGQAEFFYWADWDVLRADGVEIHWWPADAKKRRVT